MRVRLEESGKFVNSINSYYGTTPFVDGVGRFIHGTGSGRLDRRFLQLNPTLNDVAYSGENAVPIFECYTEVDPGSDPSTGTGISWRDHTLLLNEGRGLPAGPGNGAKGDLSSSDRFRDLRSRIKSIWEYSGQEILRRGETKEISLFILQGDIILDIFIRVHMPLLLTGWYPKLQPRFVSGGSGL